MIQDFPDGIKIGGISLVPTEGTRGKDKRLRFKGDKGNSCEVEFVPGDDCDPRGVQVQAQFFAVQRDTDLGYARVDVSIVGNSDGVGEDCIIDSTTSGGRRAIPIIIKMGGDAESDPPEGGYTALKIYWDGSVVGYKKNGQMVELSEGAARG